MDTHGVNKTKRKTGGKEGQMSELIKIDGFDAAIIGVASRIGSADFLVYSREKCIEILMADDDMNYDDADEYFDFNIADAYVGEATPAFIEKYEEEEEQ